MSQKDVTPDVVVYWAEQKAEDFFSKTDNQLPEPHRTTVKKAITFGFIAGYRQALLVEEP